MMDQHQCECEHGRHWEPGESPYGHRSRDVAAYVTPFGTFRLCFWCWEICHGCAYPTAVPYGGRAVGLLPPGMGEQ